MSMVVGELVFKVKASTATLKTDIDRANVILKGLVGVNPFGPARPTGSLLDQLGLGGGVLSTITATTAAVAALTAATGAFVIKVSSDMQQANIAFKTLLGSGDAAKAMLNDLKLFAGKTPFTFTSAQDSARLLLAYGLTAEQVMPTLQALGDISMGSQEKFQRLALAFGQVMAKGKLMGQELNQLRESSFNPLEFISKRTGETMDQLAHRMEFGPGIKAREVAIALQDATTGVGRFAGSMEEMNKTLAGQWAQLFDALEELGRIAGEGMMPGLTEGLKQLNETLFTLQEAFKKIKAEAHLAGGAIEGFFAFFGLKGASLEGFNKKIRDELGIGDKPILEIKKLEEVFKELPNTLALSKEEIKELDKTLDDFDNALKERAKEREGLYKDAEKIFNSTRTPLEKLAMEIADAQKLFDDGWISSDTFNRALAKMEEELAGFGSAAVQGNSAKREFSAEAFTALEQSRRKDILGETAKEELRVAKEHVELTRRLVAAAEADKGGPPVKHVKGRF